MVDGLHINGENTQGENIADLGGLIMGFEAFKKTDQYKNNVIIGGFTPAQRYFLGHAQAWMMQFRPEALATRVKSDEHAPAKWRVLGPLSNTVEFYEAFDVKEGISEALPLNDNGEMTNDNVYDLQGRRVTKPTRGLYIVNGRKVVIK